MSGTKPPAAPGDPPGPLAGMRVVEIARNVAGPYAAKLLADYGADVVRIEPPGGDPARLRGPFASHSADPDQSGLFLYLNTNRHPVALDPSSPAGRAAVETLLAGADAFVTNLALAELEALELAPAQLRARHPALVITVVSPFGIDGPWAGRRGAEIVTYSMGGLAYSTPGMPDAAADLHDEPPLHPGCYAAETIAGVVAATATLAALHARARGGDGALVEVTQQAAVAAMQHRDLNNASYLGRRHERVFSAATTGRMPNFYLPCKDGYVAIPAPLEAQWVLLVDAMGNPEWARAPEFATGAARQANALELRRRITEWTVTLSGDELYRLAGERRLLVFPFYPVRRMLATAHVKERASTVGVTVGGRDARMPAAPVALRRTPWRLRRPAPRRGEHDPRFGAGWPDTGHAPAAGARGPALPLAGVRVLDLGQFIAAPFCALWLAWMGAEVITVESKRRMTGRNAPPFVRGHAGEPNASGYFNLLYASKKSCTIDVTSEAGRALVLRLAGAVDVMVDNFASGVLEKLGLGYEAVRERNPRIVAFSCGAFGRSGPMRGARGLHSAVNLFSGVADVTGYPGGAPRILGGVLPDTLSGTYGAFAILAALHHRDRTGEGQYIDLAMYEAMMTLIPEAVIDCSLYDRDPVRTGNRDRLLAPHGIYPCCEPDTWVALCVENEADWAALCTAADHADWRTDARFVTNAARLAHVESLDAAIAGWTRTMDVGVLTERLQSHGLAAGPVLRTDQLLDDPCLQHLGVVISTDHPVAGKRRQLGLPWRSDTVRADYRRAPLFGEHTHDVLREVLGLSGDEIEALSRSGVLE